MLTSHRIALHGILDSATISAACRSIQVMPIDRLRRSMTRDSRSGARSAGAIAQHPSGGFAFVISSRRRLSLAVSARVQECKRPDLIDRPLEAVPSSNRRAIKVNSIVAPTFGAGQIFQALLLLAIGCLPDDPHPAAAAASFASSHRRLRMRHRVQVPVSASAFDHLWHFCVCAWTCLSGRSVSVWNDLSPYGRSRDRRGGGVLKMLAA